MWQRHSFKQCNRNYLGVWLGSCTCRLSLDSKPFLEIAMKGFGESFSPSRSVFCDYVGWGNCIIEYDHSISQNWTKFRTSHHSSPIPLTVNILSFFESGFTKAAVGAVFFTTYREICLVFMGFPDRLCDRIELMWKTRTERSQSPGKSDYSFPPQSYQDISSNCNCKRIHLLLQWIRIVCERNLTVSISRAGCSQPVVLL